MFGYYLSFCQSLPEFIFFTNPIKSNSMLADIGDLQNYFRVIRSVISHPHVFFFSFCKFSLYKNQTKEKKKCFSSLWHTFHVLGLTVSDNPGLQFLFTNFSLKVQCFVNILLFPNNLSLVSDKKETLKVTFDAVKEVHRRSFAQRIKMAPIYLSHPFTF